MFTLHNIVLHARPINNFSQSQKQLGRFLYIYVYIYKKSPLISEIDGKVCFFLLFAQFRAFKLAYLNS